MSGPFEASGSREKIVQQLKKIMKIKASDAKSEVLAEFHFQNFMPGALVIFILVIYHIYISYVILSIIYNIYYIYYIILNILCYNISHIYVIISSYAVYCNIVFSVIGDTVTEL